MDHVRDFDDGRTGTDDSGRTLQEGQEAGGDDLAETQIAVGTDERRMHVRAYNYWVSLLGGRGYPSINDLDPGTIADFGPHSVLLDFTKGIENPGIAYLGRALREECALDGSTTHIAQVPSRSLLSRLTDHYLQIIANRSPIGFEAEFVSTRGHNTLYRGILMPFSSDEDTIDFIYGVINWKELVDAEMQARLHAEIEAARVTPRSTPSAPVWADGPSHALSEADTDEDDDRNPVDSDDAAPLEDDSPARPEDSLADRLMLAQQTAAAVRAADTRSRATLYRALARAHDFAAAADADPHGYETLLAAARIAVQLRAPMTPVVKLVFGADYDKTRLTEYAAVLAHARRMDVPTGGLIDFLDGFDGGIKGVVKAERLARTPTARPRKTPSAMLAKRPTLASVTLSTAPHEGDYVVLLARSGAPGTLDIVATISDDSALTERAMRRATS
ncbi:PAS domain-containing protein [Sphingomonas sp. PAMC 26621]|uniref:PAS domain-containing protein n=1 Tax=Sphingomonas sp. PAMC 26621 TaxID=1112213 RepID=UPI0002880703|nr:hypothetical protein [Sphingomonas sp. PAMC 26621]